MDEAVQGATGNVCSVLRFVEYVRQFYARFTERDGTDLKIYRMSVG